MSVIAIIGAGPGLGLAIARIFGAHGYAVGFLSRTPDKMKPLVSALRIDDIRAAVFAANVHDRTSISSGLRAVKLHFGAIDVLEYSPVDATMPLAAATALSHENVQAHLDFQVHGALAAVDEVLPNMLAKRSGTILFTTGASSIHPEKGHDMFANFALASAAVRNWAHALHVALAPKGVQVGNVAISEFSSRRPGATPDAIAPLYWELHTQRDQIEKVFMFETGMSG
jgi:NADP-dependent 3-hydroxy acid dehydrogenase YdfG